jgi:hypothetical protein
MNIIVESITQLNELKSKVANPPKKYTNKRSSENKF